MSGVLQPALALDRQVTEGEQIVLNQGHGEFIEPQRIVLPEIKGLEIESGHVTADVGLHVVLGRNHAGKTRFLRAVGGGQFQVTARLAQLPKTIHGYQSFNEYRDLDFIFTWARFRELTHQSTITQKEIVTPVSMVLDLNSSSDPAFQGRSLAHQHSLALRKFIAQRVRIRPAVIVPTERYIQAEARLDSRSDSLDHLSAFPAILENLQRDTSTRSLFAKIHEAFRDVTEGLTLDFLGTGGISHLHIVEQDNTLVPVEHCGDGLRDLLVILSYIHVYERCDLMLDEPGLRLHPHAQRRLLRYLESVSRNRAIWIASHDGVFVGAPSVRTRHLVVRDLDSRVSKVSVLPSEAQVRHAVAHLGWAPRDALLAERVLLCEGEADATVFRAVLDRLAAEEPEMGGTLVAELGGDGCVWSRDREALELITLLRRLSPHAQHVLVVDPGDASKRARAEDVVRFYRDKGVRLRLLARNELENYFLTPRLVRELLANVVRLGRWPEGVPPPAEPSEEDVAQALHAIDSVNAKGSELLDQLSRRLLNRGYKKTEGARWAAVLLPTHAPVLEEMLRLELREALTTT